MSAQPAEVSTRRAAIAAQISTWYGQPLLTLIGEANGVHRLHHDPRRVQKSTLLSIKTGGCPEDCSYCGQSARYQTAVETQKLLDVETVVLRARAAKEAGADRFCMGAGWREVRDNEHFERVLTMVQAVKALGLETCATLGMLDEAQAERLRDAGLDYYNHNLDTSRSHYDQVITTRTYDDRLATLAAVRRAGLKTCCGGILGLGETDRDRIDFLCELACLDPAPTSVPINVLMPIEGTPLGSAPPVPWHVLVRVVATARLAMPGAVIRLSAGRERLSPEAQALAFLAGANSIFVGERLLTAPNPEVDADRALFEVLGLHWDLATE